MTQDSLSFTRFIERFSAAARRINPARDWLTLLTLAGITFAGILAWNLWAFNTVANGGTIGSGTAPSTPVFSPASLDAINQTFAKRSAEEQKYLTGVYRFTDPSQ